MGYVRNYWFLFIALALILAEQRFTFAYFWENWDKPDSYYSHGALVPLLALVIAWYRRDLLRPIKYCGTWIGIPVIIVGLVTQVVGLTFSWEPLYGLAFLILLVGLIISLFGTRTMLALALPVSFLITMIPLPASVLDTATSRYQLVATAIAAKIIGPFIGGVTKTGNLITSDNLPQPLLVGTPCSGLKLLIALIMVSLFLAYMLDGPRWKKVVLISLSFPFSIIINSIRIVMIGMVGYWTESADAMESFHDFSGYIGLAICAITLLGTARLMGMRQFVDFSALGSSSHANYKNMRPLGLSIPSVLAAGLLVSGIYVSSFIGGLYKLPKGHLVRSDIPASFGSWSSHNLVIEKSTLEELSAGDLLSRSYVDNHSGKEIQVFMDASLDLSAFHSPRICLPGSGVNIIREQIIPIRLCGRRPHTIRATLLHTESKSNNGLILYWYTCGTKTFAHASELLRFTHSNRLDDLRTLISCPSQADQVRDATLSRQVVWYRFSTDITSDEREDLQALKKFAIQFYAEESMIENKFVK